jgi:peptide chain release factor 1
MLEKLKIVEQRYEQVLRSLSDPDVVADREKFRELAKENAALEPIINCYRRLQKVSTDLAQNRDIVQNESDEEFRQLAVQELESLAAEEDKLKQELFLLMLPKDPNDDKNIIFEIRAGAGGDESALFAAELFSMYSRYADTRGWTVEILSVSPSSVGGYKEIIGMIRGHGAFSRLKYEKGVHRVQRVPKTETQGRVHTSTVTVAILPEAEEVEIEINDKDLRIDVFRSSGPGGQSVNTTDSAVRVTHLPTGMVVTCQDEKSQFKNKAKALTVLRARLFELMQEEQDAGRRDDRRSQIGTGERSEKIRTYNFPQGRVTDHRIGLTIYQIDEVVRGDLDVLIEPLISHYRAESLKEGERR